ncbi:MAG: CRTAC1 family protein, partial [Vicinamibacterales bacterium]
GVADPGWSVSASFFDYDRDGRLDLFVSHYVEYRLQRCLQASTLPDYCGPKSYTPERDTLFHNLGGGRFEDVSPKLLGNRREGAGLGVVSGDYDGDGWVDLYVANDGSDNHLWLNEAGRALRESGLLSGAALSWSGVAQAGMGTDAGDVDGDGDLDLFVTNLVSEGNSLYTNIGRGLFEDRSSSSGLAAPSLPWTGFGARFLDYDNDGVLDLAVVNGAVHLKHAWSSTSALAEPMQIYRGLGGGRFEDQTAKAGDAVARRDVSRGLATGDVDNDGDIDLLIGNADAPARLLLNNAGQQQPWIGLRLVEADGRRDAYGARVVLRRRGAPDLVRHVHADGSYASTSDPRLLFGLGGGRNLVAVDVQWPGGSPLTSHERFAVPPLQAYSTLRRGTGRAVVPQ